MHFQLQLWSTFFGGKVKESPTRLLQQRQRIHRQTVRNADGQALHGLTDTTPAQRALVTVLQLLIPTPAELSQPDLWSALLTLGPNKSTTYVPSRVELGWHRCDEFVTTVARQSAA
jgi:hypothetical protein